MEDLSDFISIVLLREEVSFQFGWTFLRLLSTVGCESAMNYS